MNTSCECTLTKGVQAEQFATKVAVASAVVNLPVSNLQMVRFEETDALNVVNEFRQQSGLMPLRIDTRLTDVSRKHVSDLARRDVVSHLSNDGATLEDRLQRGGVDAVSAAENVSGGQRDFDEAFQAWVASSSHREKLLLPDLSTVGFAYIYDPMTEYRTFWVMIMAEPF